MGWRWLAMAQYGEFRLQGLDPLDQAGDGLGHRVGQEIVVQADAVLRSPGPGPGIHDASRNTYDRAVGRLQYLSPFEPSKQALTPRVAFRDDS
jgi:hypothetical protein